MKKFLSFLVSAMLIIASVFCVGGCGAKPDSNGNEQGGGGGGNENPPTPVYTLDLSETSKTLNVGESFVLYGYPKEDGVLTSGNVAMYSGDCEGIATIASNTKESKATITATAAGTFTVTARWTKGGNPITKTCSVTVIDYKLTLSKTEIDLQKGDTATITATFTNGGEEESKNIEFSSSDTSVMTIESNGEITAIGKGRAEIIAEIKDLGMTEKCVVNVYEEIDKPFDITDEEMINYYGRVYINDNKVTFYNTASGFEVRFKGTSISANFTASKATYLRVYVDGDTVGERIEIGASGNKTLCSGLTDTYHTVKVLKCNSEAHCSTLVLNSITATKFTTPKVKPALKFEFYGDSITAGYGVLTKDPDNMSNEDGTLTYAQLTADHFGAQASMLCRSGISVSAVYPSLPSLMGKHGLNAGTPTWNYNDYLADIVVIELGANDMSAINGLSGTAKTDAQAKLSSDYVNFVKYIREYNANAKIICLFAVIPNCWEAGIYCEKAIKALNDSNVYIAKPTASTSVQCWIDGGNNHPTEKGHKQGAEFLINYIEENILTSK